MISYDMPWNPQRVVQRYGRVVRLKSPHQEVSLITMLPEQGDLERLLRLEAAIRRKIVAARPYGMEIEVMEGDVDEEIQNYARRLAEGDVSLIDEPDSAGVPQALSAELLRAELRRAGSEGELNRVQELPWGVGAAFAQGTGVPSVGPSGVFFACRTRDGERHWRYISADGDIASAPPVILRRINPGRAPGVADPPIDLEAAWMGAADSIIQEHNDAASHLAGRSLGPTQQWARDVLDHPDVSSLPAARLAYDALEIERSSQIRQALGSIRRELDRDPSAIGNVDPVSSQFFICDFRFVESSLGCPYHLELHEHGQRNLHRLGVELMVRIRREMRIRIQVNRISHISGV